MKKIVCFAFLAVLAIACAPDKEEIPVFVTDVKLPAGEVFAPGDEVKVSAQGFAADDDIVLEINWLHGSGSFAQEGCAKGVRGIVTSRTPTSITFLAPGHYPASEVSVGLWRAGRMQWLGKIAVTDGQPPATFSLYGIVGPGAGIDTPRGIDRIDLTSGETTRIADYPQGQELVCAVSAVGTNLIYGLVRREPGALGAFYDLTMHYLHDSDPDDGYLLAGALTSDVAYLRSDDNRLYLTSMSTTRTSPVVTPVWKLPDGLTPQMLSLSSFVLGTDSALLLAADNADGTFSPVVLFSHMDAYRVYVGEPVSCAALIPFHTFRTKLTDGQPAKYLVGGYVVSAAGGGASELRLFDTVSLSLEDPFATVPGAIRSVAVDYDTGRQEIYCLLDTPQGARSIGVYSQTENTWRALPGSDYPYSEIVLAR